MPKILIVGGGYAGFYTAWKLEKALRPGEAEVTMVDPLPYMTYQPFLPEVAAGSIEPRHAVVAHRRHLGKTRVVTAKVTKVDHATKTATITPQVGEPWEETYDTLVMTAGAVSRTFPIAGVAEEAIGLKTIEEAAAIRDKILTNFAKAANLPAGPERERLLTVVVVGGGFAGIEIFAELRSFATNLLRNYPTISFDETHFHLVEAMGRIMPEVSLETSHWVLKNLAERGAEVHLDTQLASAVGGVCQFKPNEGEIQTVESDLIIWTAGVMANPMVKGTDLPLEPRGRIRVQPDLRVVDDNGIVADAWACGDVAAVPDLTGGGVGGMCVPNAQHAVRQAKQLAKNLVAVIRGEEPKDYKHENLGAVAGLGLGIGVFQSGKFAMKGFLAWGAHRGYHGLAMPSWERKVRVVGDWLTGTMFGRDIVSLDDRETPRAAFETFASRPKPPMPEAGTPEGASGPVYATPADDVSKDVKKDDAAPAAKTTTRKPAARKAAAPKADAAAAAQPVAEPAAESAPVSAKAE
ncbi:NAD(P)/FAD-dependent oxidoreductase [Curtobacterium sp. MCBD17_034]|uniref:NAD(P)/FAD-dependent oxidoreductase n=1 Tax=unclassified Curtobacterium TaxID=257496 RepID=UPI000DA7A193|nr:MULTISPECIES: FAD-dependent oxidoreductase [unclassified Curtobacterium]PZF55448.1 NAD(P)/FAD-dependent oxidoreductase [Curtobacterium sp. MCBD17_034]PZM33229.1 NAD(P)/FAD-dependent oxidoreductase [Curtobacterium sp. MCBD17_031]